MRTHDDSQKFDAFFRLSFLSVGAIGTTFESYGFLARSELYKVTRTKDEDEETDHQAARQAVILPVSRGGVGAKTKKSFGGEGKRKRRSNDGRDRIGREMRGGEKEAPAGYERF